MKIRSALLACAFAGALGSAQSFAQNAYVPKLYRGDLSVINTETNTVIATIPLSGTPVGGEVPSTASRSDPLG